MQQMSFRQDAVTSNHPLSAAFANVVVYAEDLLHQLVQINEVRAGAMKRRACRDSLI